MTHKWGSSFILAKHGQVVTSVHVHASFRPPTSNRWFHTWWWTRQDKLFYMTKEGCYFEAITMASSSLFQSSNNLVRRVATAKHHARKVTFGRRTNRGIGWSRWAAIITRPYWWIFLVKSRCWSGNSVAIKFAIQKYSCSQRENR